MAKAHVRFGAEIRKLAAAANAAKRARYVCPTCGKKKVRRQGYAIWECRACGTRFAGGAYAASTPVGEAARRLIEEQAPKK
ncbi:MAG: 50S ribosomal protein L37ae [Candidatus Micrarchaeia archaeon]